MGLREREREKRRGELRARIKCGLGRRRIGWANVFNPATRKEGRTDGKEGRMWLNRALDPTLSPPSSSDTQS